MTTTTNTTNTTTIIPGITRIQDVDGYVGTIVYIGPVASAKDPTEHYAGVVWDDPSRGKHDGSVICRRTNQLVRHFFCPHPCGASFLRMTKLDLGVPLNATLLRSKYVTADSTELVAPNNLLPHTVRTSSGNAKPIEFYGELQIRARQQLTDLQEISLRRMGIARLDCSTKEGELLEFSHLKGLDLAGNLISDWTTVLLILQQFPNLETLSVAANRIRDPTDDSMEQTQMFPKIQTMNLNQCAIASVKTLLWIGKILPQLQNLCLAHANFSQLDPDTSSEAARHFSNLRHLDLTDCQLSSWETQIVPLCSSWMHLETLNLDDNPIDTTNILHDGTNTPSVYFPQLSSLQINGTQISNWQSLDGLARLPRLQSLWFRRCPLLSTIGTAEARAVTIARVSQLTKLNASQITPKERIEAERRYVSTVACQLLQWTESTEERNEFLQQHHASFHLLLEKHRDAIAATTTNSMTDSPRSVTTSTTAAAMRVVNVTIQSMAPSSCQQEPLVRRLPASLSVKRIKAMCARSFGLDPDLQRLSFRTEFDSFPTEMDDEEHTLAYYGVSDGATIYMNEIDVLEIQQQQEKARQEQTSKLERQEAYEMEKQKHKQLLLQQQN